jgi:hypothetical protein
MLLRVYLLCWIIWFNIFVGLYFLSILKVPFTVDIMPIFLYALNKIILFGLSLANLVGLFCRIMFAGSPQRRIHQRTEGDRAALRAKIMDRPLIAKRNVVRSDIMVAPLDSVHDIIQTYHWGYLHSCACVVYTRLVRLFYTNLGVVQDDDRGLVLQSTIGGYTITIDPQIIS